MELSGIVVRGSTPTIENDDTEHGLTAQSLLLVAAPTVMGVTG